MMPCFDSSFFCVSRRWWKFSSLPFDWENLRSLSLSSVYLALSLCFFVYSFFFLSVSLCLHGLLVRCSHGFLEHGYSESWCKLISVSIWLHILVFRYLLLISRLSFLGLSIFLWCQTCFKGLESFRTRSSVYMRVFSSCYVGPPGGWCIHMFSNNRSSCIPRANNMITSSSVCLFFSSGVSDIWGVAYWCRAVWISFDVLLYGD